jgi:hypothetical protein
MTPHYVDKPQVEGHGQVPPWSEECSNMQERSITTIEGQFDAIIIIFAVQYKTVERYPSAQLSLSTVIAMCRIGVIRTRM